MLDQMNNTVRNTISVNVPFNDQQNWIKRDSGLFDVMLGACNGAEVCELVENYLPYELSKLFEKKDISGF